MTKLKILLVIPTLSKGGAERMVVNIARFLQKNGMEVRIILFRNEISYPIDDLTVKILEPIVLLSIIKKSMVDVTQIQREIDNFQPNIVHSHLFESEIVLAHISFSKNTKRIIHFHDNMIQMKKFSLKTLYSKNAITNLYERHIVFRNLKKTPAKIITISKHSYEFALENLGHSFPVSLIHNAIDISQFKPIRNLQDSKIFSCAMIGSFVEKKGQITAIETIFELKKRNVFLKLYLVGDGINRAKMEQLAINLQIDDQIVFTGNIDHPEFILQNCTFYLHTAKYEPFGLVIIEAMACGLPVITTDGIGNRDLIQEGENGFMVMKRDPKLIADKIEILLSNNTLSKNMSENASRFASKFGLIEYISKLLIIYNNSF